MTDLEITRLCAEAMGYEYSDGSGTICVSKAGVGNYDPLHDDAQAMALVKKFRLEVQDCGKWFVSEHQNADAFEDDLNRAICLTVARMQQVHERTRS